MRASLQSSTSAITRSYCECQWRIRSSRWLGRARRRTRGTRATLHSDHVHGVLADEVGLEREVGSFAVLGHRPSRCRFARVVVAEELQVEDHHAG